MKYIEIDKHIIKEKLDSGLICTSCVSTDCWIEDLLTKGLSNTTLEASAFKLEMVNIYSPAWGEVWKNVIREVKLYNSVIKEWIRTIK